MENVSNWGFAKHNIEEIKHAIQHILGGNHVTFTLRNRETGEVLYTYRGKHLMRSASNMKIMTGAAALEVLGADYRFTTELYIDNAINDGILKGNLYIKGYGDPTLNGEAFVQFANALKQQGISEITGHLIGDDTIFPGDTLPPGVDDEGETHYWGARISPITMSPNADYDASTIIVTAEPTAIGQAPTFEVIPYLSGHEITNEAQTVAEGEENTLEIFRINDTNQIKITGQLPQGESAKVWVSLQDPTINTLQYMKHVLIEQGISFAKASQIKQAEVSVQAQLIYSHQSPTIREIFPAYMKFSNNSIADIFAKTMGLQEFGIGTYETGIAVIRSYLDSKGIEIGEWNFVDGSGLSHDIRICSMGVSHLLYVLQKEPYFDIFFDSLPVAGHPERIVGGTLRERYTEPHFENRIFAKTGYIDQVNTLSGYTIGASGQHYIFSLLQEGYEEGLEILDAGLKYIIEHI